MTPVSYTGFYALSHGTNYKDVHEAHISALEHLHRESEAHTMAAEAKANEADSETLTGFSNILNKIGKEHQLGVIVMGLRKNSGVQKRISV